MERTSTKVQSSCRLCWLPELVVTTFAEGCFSYGAGCRRIHYGHGPEPPRRCARNGDIHSQAGRPDSDGERVCRALSFASTVACEPVQEWLCCACYAQCQPETVLCCHRRRLTAQTGWRLGLIMMSGGKTSTASSTTSCEPSRRVEAALASCCRTLFLLPCQGRSIDTFLPRCRFEGLWEAPEQYEGEERVRYTSKIVEISGNVSWVGRAAVVLCSRMRRAHLPIPLVPLQTVTLERRLPYDTDPAVAEVKIYSLPDTVHEVGIEGLTFDFGWEL